MPTAPLYMLDTGVVLVLVRGGARAQAIADKFSLNDQVYRPLVSVVSHGELHALSLRNKWGKNKLETLQRALAELVTVPIDVGQIPSRYAEINAAIMAAGTPIGQNDMWIAATASCCKAKLIAFDGDFKQVPADLLSLESIE